MTIFSKLRIHGKPVFGVERRCLLGLARAGLIGGLLLAMPYVGQTAQYEIPGGDVSGLIDAIHEANNNPDCDTIRLANSTYTLTVVDNDTDGPNGLPSISSCLTIKGEGADVTHIERATNNVAAFRIVHVGATGDLTLDGVTIGNGRIEQGGGGGAFNNGNLTLTESVVRDSAVSESEADVNAGIGAGSGGGIFNNDTLVLTDSKVFDNLAAAGGGIDNHDEFAILDSSIYSNRADNASGAGACGGVRNTGHITMSSTTVAHNTAGVPGGGICNTGAMELDNSTISNNLAEEASGIDNEGVMSITQSTIADNHGIFSTGGLLNNGDVMVSHSIIAGNTGSDGDPNDRVPSDCSGGYTSLGHNLVATGAGCPNGGPGDLTVDPSDVFAIVLTPLQHNGGSTATHALFPQSPAIDLGQPGPCLTATDQRGIARPQGAACGRRRSGVCRRAVNGVSSRNRLGGWRQPSGIQPCGFQPNRLCEFFKKQWRCRMAWRRWGKRRLRAACPALCPGGLFVPDRRVACQRRRARDHL